MASVLFFVGPDEAPDKYRLKRQIGSGGEAQLWEAAMSVSGEWESVAVKILRPEHAAEMARWKDRWAEQAEVLRFIRHPGVVGVREHFEGGGMHYEGETPTGGRALYLVMNWVDGQTLREWVPAHGGSVDVFEPLRFLAQIGDVVDWLHSGQATTSGREIIHADITANNVLVTPAGQAVLVDFGLVRLAAGLSPVVEGTAGYLAPEVKAAGAYSPASDRYAFGALTYYVMTGTPAPISLPEIRLGFSRAPAIAEQPPAIIDHLMRMFDPDPFARPSCSEWIRHFRVSGTTSSEVVGSRPHRTTPSAGGAIAQTTQRAEPLPATRKPTSRLALIGIGVAVLAVAGIAYAVSRPGNGKATSASSSTPTSLATTTVASTAPPTSSSTTTATTSTTVAPTTTTRPPTTTAPTTTTSALPSTTAAPLVKPLPNEAYTMGANCGLANPRVRNSTKLILPVCYFTPPCCSSIDFSERSMDINVTPGSKRFSGQVLFDDGTLPVEAAGFVKVLLDATPLQEGDVTFAKPYAIDMDVTGKSRVTLRFTIPERAQGSLKGATFVLTEATFAS
jgi:serine/threonine protein kinase